MFAHKFHDLSGNFSVLLDRLSEYQDVIQVDHHNPFYGEFPEDVIHHTVTDKQSQQKNIIFIYAPENHWNR